MMRPTQRAVALRRRVPIVFDIQVSWGAVKSRVDGVSRLAVGVPRKGMRCL